MLGSRRVEHLWRLVCNKLIFLGENSVSKENAQQLLIVVATESEG